MKPEEKKKKKAQHKPERNTENIYISKVSTEKLNTACDSLPWQVRLK